MVHLTKIYTKTGDSGTTSIANNLRIHKTDPIIEAIGNVDEANSAIGLCSWGDVVEQIQNDLFDLGAELAGSKTIRITQESIDWLEFMIDKYNEMLTPLNSFVLPRGPWHFARTVVRRAERSVWAVNGANPLISTYLNRLSDLLFVMARYFTSDNEKLWSPMKDQLDK